MLNVIEQARITRRIGGLYERLQAAEAFFAGTPITTARIGTAIITNAKIADLSVTTAKIANTTIENAKINDLNATKITTGTLDADRIAAGSITASKLSVSTLAAITADLGTVNAGTITGVNIIGGTIRTASSGSRVEITSSPERLRVFDGSNQRVVMGEGSAVFSGDNSVRLYRDGDIYGQWSCSTTSFNMVATSEANNFSINGNEGADLIFQANDVVNLIATQVRFDGVTKSAIVPIGDGYKALYTAEAPEVWFMDFYEKQPDPLFLEVTAGAHHAFKCTNGKTLLFAKRKGYETARFTPKTSVEFERNNRLYA